MQIITISPRGFGANTYILTQDNQTAVVIDPAQPRVETELSRLGLTPKFVLLTHCHFDHVCGVATLQAQGAKVLCSNLEKPLVGTLADAFDLSGTPWTPFAYTVDETLCDGEERDFCNIKIKTLSTPGHTAGCATYLVTDENGEKYLFTGDTLFQGTIGRTDLPTGDLRALRQSLKKLASIEEDLPIYSGHGDPTTLSIEKKTNPFLKDA